MQNINSIQNSDRLVSQISFLTARTTISAAKLSILSVVAYQIILFALIFIRQDLDPYWHTISEYAIGPNGWIMSVGFLVSAISYGCLLMAVRSQIRGVIGYIGLGLLLICTIGVACVGIFTTDPLDTPPDAMTTRGMIHMFSGLCQLMLLPFAPTRRRLV